MKSSCWLCLVAALGCRSQPLDGPQAPPDLAPVAQRSVDLAVPLDLLPVDLAQPPEPTFTLDLSAAIDRAGPPPSCGRVGSAPSDALGRLRWAMAASWNGVATTPWTQPYPVAVRFGTDGHYSAHGIGDVPPALYYGSDADAPDKTWTLDGLAADGSGQGTLRVYFSPGDVTTGTLDGVRSDDAFSLHIDFWPSWLDGKPGPIQYDLRCLP